MGNINYVVEIMRYGWCRDGIGAGENGEPWLVFATSGEARYCIAQFRRLDRRAGQHNEYRIDDTAHPVTCTTRLPAFSEAAQLNVEEAGLDVDDIARDMATLLDSALYSNRLLDECLGGADPDRVEGWREYVATLHSHLEDAGFGLDATGVTSVV